MPTARRFERGLLAALDLCAGARAQVPDGWYVVSGNKDGLITSPHIGGLFFLHPRTPGVPITVTGLGPDLTGAGTTGVYQGAAAVLWRCQGFSSLAVASSMSVWIILRLGLRGAAGAGELPRR